jgi:RNA polymerase sigma factor (sigma-70 family)
MMKSNAMETVELSDTELVARSLGGSREAFGWIVARYQSLICALNYSATGNLSQSEDLAQETFITAWKQLAQLREPAKLRSWLCQISRNLTFDSLRKQGREPSHQAEGLEAASESHSPEPSPSERAISKEEQEILWRSIEQIPEIYREPLILFYRQHQSVEAVAGNLELSEEAVRQRLSRGRKLLSEQVTAFVEGALERTNPGNMFAAGVVAALPALTISSKAALLGAAAAKGVASVKMAMVTGALGAALAPVLSLFTGWFGYRMSVDTARSDRERKFNRGFFWRLVGSLSVFFLIYLIIVIGFRRMVTENHLLFVSLIIGLALAYVIAMAVFSIESYHLRKRLLADLTPEEWATKPTTPVWEYRSRREFLGMPLIHLRAGDRLAPPVRAWIAAGDCALGGLFAFGGLAIAPVSLGGCAVGLISFGGLSIGALSLGGTALGVWAFGGLALGWQAFGGCALAWNAAWGGYAIARAFAVGGVVHAAQANNPAAIQFMQANPFFRISGMTLPYLLWLNLVWIVPMMMMQRITKRAKQQQSASPLQ